MTTLGVRSRPQTAPTRRPRRRLTGEALAGWGFVAPALVVVGGLTLFPGIWALVLSFRSWDGFSPPTAVGTQNYQDLLTDAALGGAVLHTLLYTVMFVPASLLLGLLLATALNRRIRFIGLYRTAVFVPFVASAAATGILTTYLFSPQFGLVNNVLRVLHLPQQGWLEDSHQAMVVITIMSLWGQAAFTTVIYLAALQDIPGETIEAARIDGAGSAQIFWRVVWPQLRPVTTFVGIYQTLQAVQLFDLVYATTRGGPLDATQTIVYQIWTTAFQKLQFGYGSAVAYALFFVTLAVTVVVTLAQRRAGRTA
ncbi:carbohydrate ABC transporter permease [Kineococcus rhizosphaerae]|uniref:Carbohydrate ABC transporter membrane protein 1 (CUT1 family) n=1 Tax=Kineococcus rhizosphaerae TaxID=559628 RepID=A0A2T0R3B0_9ACTN|nr:sugar ABC transporter permease [Kineococcus rhizosphaerae]PRY14511.1 carbohydrate ABC transporter membrane protein 1 (CUT1 family) [Kineococcus rhizosphaerae]